MPNCKSCHAPIKFAKTARGQFIPLNAEPSHKGKIALVAGIAVFVAKDRIEEFTASGGKLYESHFSTCPNKTKHRKVKPVPGADASKSEPPF